MPERNCRFRSAFARQTTDSALHIPGQKKDSFHRRNGGSCPGTGLSAGIAAAHALVLRHAAGTVAAWFDADGTQRTVVLLTAMIFATGNPAMNVWIWTLLGHNHSSWRFSRASRASIMPCPIPSHAQRIVAKPGFICYNLHEEIIKCRNIRFPACRGGYPPVCIA